MARLAAKNCTLYSMNLLMTVFLSAEKGEDNPINGIANKIIFPIFADGL